MNLLANEASPYLRQHRENPVHWRAWSGASLAEAAELDRPILLSIGYAACHWCHVMAHESFEDEATAEVMNRLFTNIKVDREERPDIDQIYMAALSATGEQGGWPLTMFLAPDGRPFWGGTYFPRQARHGRPAFVDVLKAVSQAWTDRRAEIERSATGLRDFVSSRLASTATPSGSLTDMLGPLAEGVGSHIDLERGGLRGAPKFPNAPMMTTLWLSWLRDGRTDHRDAVILSLRPMLMGGIYDHVGGGLCRYSTDDRWLVPHFEKMLYDNAQLLRLASWVYAETGDELFRNRIIGTVEWMLRELRLPQGGFASSLDADSEGEEGLFYTWTEAEIAEALGAGRTDLANCYRLETPPTWEGKPILRAVDGDPENADAVRAALDRLRQFRDRRPRPGLDDKVVTEWNGLAIVALVEAGRMLVEPRWVDAAIDAYRFVSESSDADGRLPRSALGDARLYPAMSSDVAAMINAAIALHGVTGESKYVADAARWSSELDRWYTDGSGRSHFLTASDSADVPIRIRGDVDEAIPSATGQIVEALYRLAMTTGRPDDHVRALNAAEAAARVKDQPYGQSGVVNAIAIGSMITKLVTIDDPGSRQFAAIADRKPSPCRVDVPLTIGDPPAELPEQVVTLPDTPGAYLCTATTCLPPFTDPSKLAVELERTKR
ncbi:MAG: thioredoxin domain-containing protein [Rhizobiaceae bacterium]